MEPEPLTHPIHQCDIHSKYHYTNFIETTPCEKLKETLINKCSGCENGEANQLSHMYPGGCLYVKEPIEV